MPGHSSMASSRASHSHGNHPAGYAPGNGSSGGLPPSPASLGWSSWIDASDAAYRTLDGTEVVQLQDKVLSGATWDRIGAAQGPSIDTGTGIMTFNGTSQGLISTTATVLGWLNGAGAAESATIMALAKWRTTANAAGVLSSWSLVSVNYRGGMLASNTGAGYLIGRRALTATAGTMDTDWHAYETIVNAVTSRMQRDGVDVVTGDFSAAAAWSPDSHCIGFRKSSSAGPNVGFFDGDLIEHVIYAGTATADMETGVRAYWAAKHGLTS